MTKWGAQVTYGFNMFAPTRTLLHTYSHHHHHHDHHHYHHIMIIIASKFASPSEQYVGWGNNINFIFMRDQNSPAGDGGVWSGPKHFLPVVPG